MALPPTGFQNSYPFRGFSAKPGQLADAFSPRAVTAHIARGPLLAGYMGFKVPVVGGAGSRNSIDPGEVYQRVLAGTAANTTAILASGGASATTIQTVSGAQFNGTYGQTELQPARQITMVLNNNANWDATTAVLRGYNHEGAIVSENLSIPDTGNTTLTSVNRYRSLISLTIPVQAGTGGTYTLGISALSAGALTADDFYGVIVEDKLKTAVSNNNLYGYPGYGSATFEANYVDGDTVPCLQQGHIWVYSETAVTDRAPVYCRIASGAGGSVLGAFRTDADTATAILVPNARFHRDSTAAGAAWVRFGPF
jgi:hypothetical protein